MILDNAKVRKHELALKVAYAATNPASEDIKQSKDAPFLVTAIRTAAYLNGDQTAKSGTLLPAIPSATLASNTMPMAASVTAKYSIGDMSVQSVEVPLPLLGGYGEEDEILAEPFFVQPEQPVKLTRINNSGLNIDVWLILKGFKVFDKATYNAIVAAMRGG